MTVARSETKKEIRRYELAVVNNLEEPIDVLSVVPTCGCIGVESAVQGLRLDAFDGKSFQISVDMNGFRNVNLEVLWRRTSQPAKVEKCVARLIGE